MSKCGFTVTGTRTRYECFLRQLKAHGIVIYHTLQKLFYVPLDKDIRKTIQLKIHAPETYHVFCADVRMKCPDLVHIIQSTLTPYIHLMGLGERHMVSEHLQTIDDCVRALWTFFIRIIYEKPVLLLPDSIQGENVLYLQESFHWFISEQVKTIRPTKKNDSQ